MLIPRFQILEKKGHLVRGPTLGAGQKVAPCQRTAASTMASKSVGKGAVGTRQVRKAKKRAAKARELQALKNKKKKNQKKPGVKARKSRPPVKHSTVVDRVLSSGAPQYRRPMTTWEKVKAGYNTYAKVDKNVSGLIAGAKAISEGNLSGRDFDRGLEAAANVGQLAYDVFVRPDEKPGQAKNPTPPKLLDKLGLEFLRPGHIQGGAVVPYNSRAESFYGLKPCGGAMGGGGREFQYRC